MRFHCRQPKNEPRTLAPGGLRIIGNRICHLPLPRHCIKSEIGVDILRDTIQTGLSIRQRQCPFCRHKYGSHRKSHLRCDIELAVGYIGYSSLDIDGQPDIMTRRTASEQIFQCSDRFDVKDRVVYGSGRREEELTEGGFWLWNLLRQLWELLWLVNKSCATRGR